MKNCWPLANNLAPLTEIVGMAVAVAVEVKVKARKLHARRRGV